jgi:hypothetical protein
MQVVKPIVIGTTRPPVIDREAFGTVEQSKSAKERQHLQKVGETEHRFG